MKTFEFEGIVFVPTGIITVDNIEGINGYWFGITLVRGSMVYSYHSKAEATIKRNEFIDLLNNALKN